MAHRADFGLLLCRQHGGRPLGVLSYSTLSAFKFGPFARYYTNIGLFGHVGTNYISREFAKDDFDLALGLGYAAFLGRQVSLEPLLSLVLLDGDPYARFGIALQVYFNR